MDRILARKSAMFDKMEITRNSLFLGLMKCLLMTVMERVRKIRFTRNGLQQMQLDVYFLIQLAFDLVSSEEENLIIGFYHEIVESAKPNSDEAGLLDPTVRSPFIAVHVTSRLDP